MKTFGERLQTLRQDNDETQRELAEILNISPRMISYFEADTHFPRDAQIIRSIANHFNVSTDYLFGLNEHKGQSSVISLYEKLSPKLKLEAEEYIKYLTYKNNRK